MLNGWQRIWIVLGVIFLLLSGMLLVEEIPTKNDINRSWTNETIALILKLKTFEKLSVLQVRKIYNDLSDEEIREKIQIKFSDPKRGYNLDFSRINAEHESKLKNLSHSQIKTVGSFIGVWISVMLAIYVFGWSIGWVIRGFKHKKS